MVITNDALSPVTGQMTQSKGPHMPLTSRYRSICLYPKPPHVTLTSRYRPNVSTQRSSYASDFPVSLYLSLSEASTSDSTSPVSPDCLYPKPPHVTLTSRYRPIVSTQWSSYASDFPVSLYLSLSEIGTGASNFPSSKRAETVSLSAQ